MLFLQQNKRVLMATATVSLLLVIILGSCYLYHGHPHYKSDSPPTASLFKSTATVAKEGNTTTKNVSDGLQQQNSSKPPEKDSDAMLSDIMKHLLPPAEITNSTPPSNLDHSKDDIKMVSTLQYNPVTESSASNEKMAKPDYISYVINEILNGTQSKQNDTSAKSNQSNAEITTEGNDDAFDFNKFGDDSDDNSTMVVVIDIESDDNPSDSDDNKNKKVPVYDTDTSELSVESVSSLHLVKVVTINRVEEVFEDLINENVHRIIKEDRIERTEFVKDREADGDENDINIKSII